MPVQDCGLGPPHLAESSHAEHSQSTRLEHVAVSSVQPELKSPGVKQPGSTSPCPLRPFQHHCMLSSATHAWHVCALGVGGGVGDWHAVLAQFEHAHSAKFEHVASDFAHSVLEIAPHTPVDDHHTLPPATHSMQLSGVGEGPGPPHAAESLQSEHAQSIVMLHVERGRLQPSPGVRQ